MLEAIFAPQSVAIVGASPDPSKLGHRVLRNIVDNDFTGRLFPIHPTAPRVLDLPAYPSVTAIPDPVDLAVIVVPSQAVLPVVDECGAKGVLIQEQVRKGRELLVGVNRDPQFGPLIAFGMGGIYVEVLKDVAFGLAPISRQEAHAQVRDIRTFPLLRGVRGEPPADIAAAEQVILRVSQMVTDFPEIVEMDINPLVVHNQGEGAIVLDARIILQG